MAVRREGTTAALTDNAVGMMDNAVAHSPQRQQQHQLFAMVG
jgi:hypothetical protein